MADGREERLEGPEDHQGTGCGMEMLCRGLWLDFVKDLVESNRIWLDLVEAWLLN